MAGNPIGAFTITPHKVSLCILLQIYASPAQVLVSFPFSSAIQHNRLGLFLLSLTKSCDNIFEPKLDELINQLDEIGGAHDRWLSEHLMDHLSLLKLPNDLFNLFSTLRSTLGPPEMSVEDDQIILGHSSQLGIFIRHCLRAFNIITLEGVSHLLTNVATYFKGAPQSLNTNELPDEDDPSNDSEELLDCEDMDLEHFVFEKVTQEIEARTRAREGSTFHIHVPRSLLGLVEELSHQILSQHEAFVFLGLVSSVMIQFGIEGIDISPSSSPLMEFGRYETALLCLGMMHCHFGHPKQALEVLTEALQVSQQHNNETCLSYTLAAICNLLSEVGISSATGIIGSSYSAVTSFASSLGIQQQLLVLLTRSLKRAESLKLTHLVASNRLAMAKFDLSHVKRPLLSFGPKSCTKLRTCPFNVFKELRLSSYLLSEFGSDGAAMTIDGAFSTAWLKNLRKPMAASIFLQDNNDFGSGCETFQYGGQPSPIPGSVLQLSGSSYLLRATAWEMYGSAPLARLNALIHATCFSDASSSADVELAYVKLIQHLSIFKGHNEAFAALKIAEDKFLSVTKSRIQMLKLQLLHDRALHRGQLKLAQRVCDEFGVLASPVSGVDMGVKTEACLRHARTLLATNQFSEAASVAHSLFCMCYKYNLQVENATTLLLLAEIYKKSGNAVSGLPYALASLSYCQSFNLDLLEASATLTLAELWLALGSNHAKRASTLVHRALPIIFGHGGLELRSRANIVAAKCYLSDSSFSVSEDFDIVLDPLRQASEELEILEYHELAAEAFYLMALVFNNLGKLEERENAATSFKRHILALEDVENEEVPHYMDSTFSA